MGLFGTASNTSSGSDNDEIWQSLTDPTKVETIIQESKKRPQLIYKHSHRCSVCFVAQGNLESASDDILNEADMHFVNVVKSREASDRIASQLDVHHQSPQAILLKNGEVVWHASHGSINADAILTNLN